MTIVELLQLMLKHLKLVIALPVACFLVTAVFGFAALPNEYTASVSMYVLTKSESSGVEGVLSNNDLAASQMLTNDVATIIKSNRVSRDVAAALGLNSLTGFDVVVDNSSSTRVITVSVTGPTPDAAAQVANQVAVTTDQIAREVMDVESINVIDEAEAPGLPSGPPRLAYAAAAFLLGLLLAAVLVVISDMANLRVRNAEEASELLGGMPIIGRIPAQRE